MTAVVVDRDVLVILLENHARAVRRGTACQMGQTTALPGCGSAGLQHVRPRCAILQRQVDLPRFMRREGTGVLLGIHPIDVIGRRARPVGVRRGQRCDNRSLGIERRELCVLALSILAHDLHVAGNVHFLVSDIAVRAVEPHRSHICLNNIVLLRVIGVLRRAERAAADVNDAVRACHAQDAALDVLDVGIALDRDVGVLGRRNGRKIAPIVPLVIRIHIFGNQGFHS